MFLLLTPLLSPHTIIIIIINNCNSSSIGSISNGAGDRLSNRNTNVELTIIIRVNVVVRYFYCPIIR